MFRALQKALPSDERNAVSAWLTCFYPFQLDIILEPARFALVNKSRKIGGSLSFGAAAVLWGLFGDTTTIVSMGQRESRIVLDYSKRHAKVLEALGSEWAQSNPTSNELKLASGGQVVALPASSGGRGFDGHIILDEFAYHGDDAKGVWDAAVGSATLKDHRIRVCSTPNGVGNKFHDLWTNATTYVKREVTVDEAIEQGYPVSRQSLLEQVGGDERLYDQLFRCKFLDNEQQYIPSALIEAAVADIPSDRRSVWDGDTYAGLDVGRSAHLTCLVIVRVDRAGIHWVHHVETLPVTTEADLHRLVDYALGPHWRCTRICIDATGIGAFPAQSIQDKHTHHRVELVNFTLASKEDMATTLYKRLADNKLRIPAESKDLRDDIASLRRIVTSAGNVRYDAPVTSRGHADRAWALALALHACSKPASTVTLT